jgi:site-specific DNA-cytosine methylase
MSIRQLRTRLDRLARSAKLKEGKGEERKVPFNFALDPALVKAMSDDWDQLNKLKLPHPVYGIWAPGPDTPEQRAVRERIAERAKTINCPPSYGFKEFWVDADWLSEVTREPRSKSEKAEAKVRMEAFKESPEGRARIRLHELENAPGLITAAECEEIDRLLKLYPEPWCSPKWTNYVSDVITNRPEARKERLKHPHWIAKREARERAKLQQENKK